MTRRYWTCSLARAQSFGFPRFPWFLWVRYRNPELDRLTEGRMGARVWTHCRILKMGQLVLRFWRWQEQSMEEWPRGKGEW